jgi:hypothetical protein
MNFNGKKRRGCSGGFNGRCPNLSPLNRIFLGEEAGRWRQQPSKLLPHTRLRMEPVGGFGPQPMLPIFIVAHFREASQPLLALTSVNFCVILTAVSLALRSKIRR